MGSRICGRWFWSVTRRQLQTGTSDSDDSGDHEARPTIERDSNGLVERPLSGAHDADGECSECNGGAVLPALVG